MTERIGLACPTALGALPRQARRGHGSVSRRIGHGQSSEAAITILHLDDGFVVAPLSSSQELYDLLIRLALELRARGAMGLAEAIDFATGQAGTSIPEFVGESRIALRRVAAESEDVLSAPESERIREILEQIDSWFQGR